MPNAIEPPLIHVYMHTQRTIPRTDHQSLQQHHNQAKPAVWIRRLAHQLLQRRRERHRRPMQHNVGPHGVPSAREQRRQEVAQGGAEGLWGA